MNIRKVNGVIITANIDSVREAHYKIGGHWFSPDTLRFFSSHVSKKVYGKRYFVSSERGPSGIRTYTVRELTDQGHIETVGEFEAYATSKAAHKAAADLAEAAETSHVVIPTMPDEVAAIIAAIREIFPTAATFGVSSSDQGRYGYWLDEVKSADGTDIDGNDQTAIRLDEDVQTEYLDNLSWGAFGDTNADSAFDVDMTTGKIIR